MNVGGEQQQKSPIPPSQTDINQLPVSSPPTTIPTHPHQKTLSIPLQSLPLRPSTLTALLRSGFSTTGDVMNSCHTKMPTTTTNGGNNINSNVDKAESTNSGTQNEFGQFAKEVGCTTSQAADYVHELNDALGSIGLPKVSAPNENEDVNGENVATNNNGINDNNIMAPHQAIFSSTAASILRSKANNHFPANGNNHQMHQAAAAKQIVSFSQALDVLLGGGFALSELTEIAGLPGVGKTQLAMQLCVNSRLPTTSGGVQGCAVVIDAEGSWSGSAGGDRLWSMASALSDHVKTSAARKLAQQRAKEGGGGGSSNINEDNNISWFTPEFILGGIHIFRVHDEASQTCTLYNLPKFLLELEQKGTPVKLVVIDSLAFHYRVASSSTSNIGSNGNNNSSNKNNSLSTTHNLTRMAAFLTELASEFDLAVVAMNHLTTRIEKDGNSNTGSVTKMVPALGESWAHSVTSRLMIDHYRQFVHTSDTSSYSEIRTCTLVKSPHKPTGTSLFKITDKGIRGVSPQFLQSQSQATKRARVD